MMKKRYSVFLIIILSFIIPTFAYAEYLSEAEKPSSPGISGKIIGRFFDKKENETFISLVTSKEITVKRIKIIRNEKIIAEGEIVECTDKTNEGFFYDAVLIKETKEVKEGDQVLILGVTKDEGYYFNRATQLFQQGKYKEAIKDWQKVLEINPDHQLSKDKIEKARAKENIAENIAVLDFKAINVSAADAVAISEFVGIALVKREKLNVVERSDIEKILAEQGFQQTGCTTDECAVQIGQILNVHKAIIGTYSRIGNSYYITAKVIDVETGKIISSEKVQCLNLDYITSSIDELVSLILGERKKITQVTHVDNFGIGFHNLGCSLRYFAGTTTLEAKIILGDEFNAFGPRLYVNLNPNSNTVVYIGGEYCQINGETELQKFTGTLTGAFVGIELFVSNKLSIIIDIGPSAVKLDSEFSGVNVTSSYVVGNIGFNLYF